MIDGIVHGRTALIRLLMRGLRGRVQEIEARVLWDGRVRGIFVDELDATPLVGMALLRGHDCRIKVQARGKVTIRRLT